MQYIGALRGTGTLVSGKSTVAGVRYDIDGFVRKPGEVTGSGELRMPPGDLGAIFGRQDMQLRTEDGIDLTLRFSERSLPPGADAAHVDIVGNAPPAAAWSR